MFEMLDSPRSVDAITLFVEGLEAAKASYQEAFDLGIHRAVPAVSLTGRARRSTCT